MNRQIELAEELFQRRLEAYWNHSSDNGSPTQSGNWRSPINDGTARKWMEESLKLAGIILEAEDKFVADGDFTATSI